jgi:rubrerythrin
LTFFIAASHFVDAQDNIDCHAIEDLLSKWENKVKKLNLEDPELIPLHYFLALDIEKELDHFSKKTIPQLSTCSELNYYKTITRFDDIVFRNSIKKLKLATLYKQVDSIFLCKAIWELQYENRTNAIFFLDKSLQCNPVYPEALLLKTRLLFEEQEYQECLALLHVLYYEAPLQRKHEIEISNFNLLFYNELYRTADSLIKKEKATEALELFKTLETFCTNLPAEYCNDDYYHGILRSREGVYESYLVIAKVAKEKGNREIEQKFLNYAEEYRTANHNELPADAQKMHIQEFVEKQQQRKPVDDIKERDNVVDDIKNIKEAEKVENIETDPAMLESNLEAITQKYNRLLIESITLTLNSSFKKAYELLKEALELEKCNCFPKDERVQKLYDALNKIYLK